MKKHIELWSGPYGSGKTTALIKKYNGHYCNTCIFIVMDGLQTIFKDHHGINTITFSDVVENKDLVKNRTIFIDDVDAFLSIDGFYPVLNILNDYNEIFMTSTNSEFFKNTKKLLKDCIICRFLESIQGIKINKLLLKDNPWLPEDYVKEICKIYKYKE